MMEYYHAALNLLKDNHFYYGAIAGAGLVVGLFLLWLIVRFFRGTCKSLVIAEEGGILEISDTAIQGFLASIITNFPQVSVCHSRILKKYGRYGLKVRLKVHANANVVNLRNNLRSFIEAELDSKLALLDKFKTIDYKIIQLPSASELQNTKQ